MKEFRVKWQQCPHIQHPARLLFVEAADSDAAKAVARDYIERKFGIEWFSIHDVTEPKAVPAGRVKEQGE